MQDPADLKVLCSNNVKNGTSAARAPFPEAHPKIRNSKFEIRNRRQFRLTPQLPAPIL
jgi:hypothetical protein